jgi:hypothetical protein
VNSKGRGDPNLVDRQAFGTCPKLYRLQVTGYRLQVICRLFTGTTDYGLQITGYRVQGTGNKKKR